MPITYLAKVDGVSEMRARVYLLFQVFNEKVMNELVGVRVEHSDSLTEGVVQEHVECVPVKKD